MKSVYYITGNANKFNNAVAFMNGRDLELIQQKLSLDEIQSSSAEDIAVKKAHDAYAQIQKPLFINDASWHIPALGGFPGPYMRYVLDWFKIEDILALMKDKEDRTIFLRDTIVYKDGEVEKVFTKDVYGKLLLEPTEGDGPFITKLISFMEDGKSLAETSTPGFTERETPLWTEFADYVESL